MPFWFSILIGLGAMAYFPLFWEACLIFLISDLLFGTEQAKLWNMVFVSFISSIVALAVIETVKKKIRF